MTDPVSAGPIAQAELLRSGAMSSRELTQATLDAIAVKNPPINAVVETMAEEALRAAEDADRRRAGGEEAPFLGIPIAVKNELDIAGHLTGSGSRAMIRAAAADD